MLSCCTSQGDRRVLERSRFAVEGCDLQLHDQTHGRVHQLDGRSVSPHSERLRGEDVQIVLHIVQRSSTFGAFETPFWGYLQVVVEPSLGSIFPSRTTRNGYYRNTGQLKHHRTGIIAAKGCLLGSFQCYVAHRTEIVHNWSVREYLLGYLPVARLTSRDVAAARKRKTVQPQHQRTRIVEAALVETPSLHVTRVLLHIVERSSTNGTFEQPFWEIDSVSCHGTYPVLLHGTVQHQRTGSLKQLYSERIFAVSV